MGFVALSKGNHFFDREDNSMSIQPSARVAFTDLESATAAYTEADKVSVVFIQDDPSLAEMYRIKLEVDGYRVTVVEADQLRQGHMAPIHPDLVFLDIRAPHRERAQVLTRLRENRATRKVPVVILSDYSQQQLRDAGVDLHRQEYLVLNFAAPSSLSRRFDGLEADGRGRLGH
jgi:response regulator RpfG family c-di-GMP phosphodiesterase